jgi:alpha-tubulin suppressor-like RCC1 family protein
MNRSSALSHVAVPGTGIAEPRRRRPALASHTPLAPWALVVVTVLVAPLGCGDDTSAPAAEPTGATAGASGGGAGSSGAGGATAGSAAAGSTSHAAGLGGSTGGATAGASPSAGGGGAQANSAGAAGAGGAAGAPTSGSGGGGGAGADPGSAGSDGANAGGSAGANAGAGGSAGTGAGGGNAGGGPVEPPVNVTGIEEVVAGEYVTSYRKQGRLYGLAGTLARLGAGDVAPKMPFPPVEVAFPADVKIVKAVGGLHLTLAVGDDGRVWTWGDTPANPALAQSHVPVHIAKDSKGIAFSMRDGAGHNVRSLAASVETSVAVKGDGTVWVWDDCSGGRQGDGTDGSPTVTQPHEVKLLLAAGVTITKIVVAEVVHALDSTGAIWSWGAKGVLENLGTDNPDFRTPHRIETTSTGAPMPPIVDLATGNGFSYALTADGQLYAWGLLGNVAGLCQGYCPAKKPVLATHVVTDGGTPKTARIASIYANSWATYVILTDGSLWAWGSNGQGLVGNGVGPDYATTDPPYTWNWSKDSYLQSTAVHIAPAITNFKTVYTGTAVVPYAYAQTTDGRLFSWGRNKTANLGNGVYPTNSHQAATYPNSWDVDTPTEVFPLTAPNLPTSSPQCIAHPDAANCWCGAGPNDPQGC